jgi:tetratricopeptide (TPR) repeat protein
MTDTGPIPTAEEIRAQLDRLLAAKRFKTARIQTKMLEFIVRRAVVGKTSSEDQVGRWLYPDTFQKDGKSNVRVLIRTLRKNLVAYKDNEGADDPITIFLPEPSSKIHVHQKSGEAYWPKIIYNPNAEIARAYRLGVAFLSPKRPYELTNAYDQFLKVVAANSQHVGARIGMAEAACLLMFTDTPAVTHCYAALEQAAFAIRFGPDYWRSHAVAGAAWFLSANLDNATLEFKKALTLDKQSTLQYGWYHAFLVATDRLPEALKFAKLRADANPGDAHIASLYGMFLYAGREFEEAHMVLSNAMELDRNCWSVHLGLALVLHASGDEAEAYLQLSHMDYCLQQAQGRPFYPGLTAYFYLTSKTRFKRSGLDGAIASLGKTEDRFYVQLALACMDAGLRQGTLEHLYAAWRVYEPVMLFLNAFPLFDPLRDRAFFRELVQHRLTKRTVKCLSYGEVLEVEKDRKPVKKRAREKPKGAKS